MENFPLLLTLLTLALAMGLAPAAHSQVEGEGWVQRFYPMELDNEIHDQWNIMRPSPVRYRNTSCSYSNSSGVETFKLDSHASNRVEVRIFNDYRTGWHQFEGEVRIVPPLNNQCVMQIFGSTSSRATLFMLRGWADNKGSLKHYDQQTLVASVYGKWVKVNIVHYKHHFVNAYINGRMVGSWTDDIEHPNFFKYGNYGSHTGPAQVQWRNVKVFTRDFS